MAHEQCEGMEQQLRSKFREKSPPLPQQRLGCNKCIHGEQAPKNTVLGAQAVRGLSNSNLVLPLYIGVCHDHSLEGLCTEGGPVLHARSKGRLAQMRS